MVISSPIKSTTIACARFVFSRENTKINTLLSADPQIKEQARDQLRLVQPDPRQQRSPERLHFFRELTQGCVGFPLIPDVNQPAPQLPIVIDPPYYTRACQPPPLPQVEARKPIVVIRPRPVRNPETYRTRICCVWRRTRNCADQDCQDAHGQHQLREIDLQKYKTRPCRNQFDDARVCRYGILCIWAHSTDELRERKVGPRYKVEMCRHGTNCKYEPMGNCKFAHSREELRYWRGVAAKKAGEQFEKVVLQ